MKTLLASCLEEVRKRIVGLEEETELAARALLSGVPVMLEGDSGTGKTEIAKAIAAGLRRVMFRVDGNQELTVAKIQGWFDPPLVIEKGFCRDSFIPGPLVTAMLNAGLFFFNEASRAPSEALNAVLSALDEVGYQGPLLVEAHTGYEPDLPRVLAA
ncbi:MAG: MoxR family ATPase, partial [Firmicutes bacterium]|nr:MoxR family ATPase [Bacillota bacterium]